METKELTIEEQNKVLAETFVERVKYICENTIMSHRYTVSYWVNVENFVLIEINKKPKFKKNIFDDYDMQLILDLKEELKDINYWFWQYESNEGIINLDIRMYNKK